MSLGKQKKVKGVLRDWTRDPIDFPASASKRNRKARKSYKHAATRRDRLEAKRQVREHE